MLLWVADSTSMLIAEPGPKNSQFGPELLLDPHSDHEVLVRPGLGQFPRGGSSSSSAWYFDDGGTLPGDELNYPSFMEQFHL